MNEHLFLGAKNVPLITRYHENPQINKSFNLYGTLSNRENRYSLATQFNEKFPHAVPKYKNPNGYPGNDIWALGVCFFFLNYNRVSTIDLNFILREEKNPAQQPILLKLTHYMLRPDPANRPTIDDCIVYLMTQVGLSSWVAKSHIINKFLHTNSTQLVKELFPYMMDQYVALPRPLQIQIIHNIGKLDKTFPYNNILQSLTFPRQQTSHGYSAPRSPQNIALYLKALNNKQDIDIMLHFYISISQQINSFAHAEIKQLASHLQHFSLGNLLHQFYLKISESAINTIKFQIILKYFSLLMAKISLPIEDCFLLESKEAVNLKIANLLVKKLGLGLFIKFSCEAMARNTDHNIKKFFQQLMWSLLTSPIAANEPVINRNLITFLVNLLCMESVPPRIMECFKPNTLARKFVSLESLLVSAPLTGQKIIAACLFKSIPLTKSMFLLESFLINFSKHYHSSLSYQHKINLEYLFFLFFSLHSEMILIPPFNSDLLTIILISILENSSLPPVFFQSLVGNTLAKKIINWENLIFDYPALGIKIINRYIAQPNIQHNTQNKLFSLSRIHKKLLSTNSSELTNILLWKLLNSSRQLFLIDGHQIAIIQHMSTRLLINDNRFLAVFYPACFNQESLLGLFHNFLPGLFMNLMQASGHVAFMFMRSVGGNYKAKNNAPIFIPGTEISLFFSYFCRDTFPLAFYLAVYQTIKNVGRNFYFHFGQQTLYHSHVGVARHKSLTSLIQEVRQLERQTTDHKAIQEKFRLCEHHDLFPRNDSKPTDTAIIASKLRQKYFA